ncbi:hypothetical protein MSAN_00116700 [Mycena sanguinolenta]|uniref:DUF6535 domain-containing protein n=1 Tax=Mycena sanguinolenta TaxID=230812 RepID=A0A8H6ZDJ8_9AGAR|nr:hypothetical protein MSAN_00116700 [Mycena sanguinolenta]
MSDSTLFQGPVSASPESPSLRRDRGSTSQNPGPPPRPRREGTQNSTGQMPFDQLLVQQFQSLNTTLDKLSAGIAALTPQPKFIEKKTAFWTAYETLAEEFDEDVQRKYGNDLDTALIFVRGSFFCCHSAFIIQIQPDLQPSPSAIIVVAQSLLYFSLFTTLLAALLAVLGKQWLLHYGSTRERGTIEEKGLERQRKLDGLKRWNFDLVMQIFPLLLQLALLLFAVGLSFYLWPVNRPIASIIFSLTSTAFILHGVMVVSALAYPDSPFQTSLTTLLRATTKFTIPWPLHNFFKPLRDAFVSFMNAFARVGPVYSSIRQRFPPLLPQFNEKASSIESSSHQNRLFENIPPASEEISAVVWALETSTDPKVVEVAAALTPSLQWPVDLDLGPSLQRLADAFKQCFQSQDRKRRIIVRDGMRDRALNCLKAFGVLRMVYQRHGTVPDLWSFYHPYNYVTDSELESMIRFSDVSLFDSQFFQNTPPITHWSLRFISAQNPSERHLATLLRFFRPYGEALADLSLLADFLFCINSFFVPPEIHDVSVMDKSQHYALLMTVVFENIANRLADVKPLDADVAKSILEHILSFRCTFLPLRENSRSTEAVYRICASPALELSTIMSVLRILRLDEMELHRLEIAERNSTVDVAWAYHALEELHTSQSLDPGAVGDLLQVPLRYGGILARPTAAVFEELLWALSCDSQRTNLLACHHLLVPTVHHCFNDDALRPLLQQYSTWSSIAAVLAQAQLMYPPVLIYPLTVQYIALGNILSQVPEWSTVVAGDLPGWLSTLAILLSGKQTDEPSRQFCAVLSRLWNTGDIDVQGFGHEAALATSFAVVANAWDQFDVGNSPDIHPLMRLIECTVTTAFCARLVNEYRNEISVPSLRFQDVIMPHLSDSVERAAHRLKMSVALDLDGSTFTLAADILSRLALTISGQLKNRPPQADRKERRVEIGYWRGLQTRFEKDIRDLPGFTQEMSLLASVPDI